MSSDSFYLGNANFEKYLKDIVTNCSEENDIEFEFKTLSEYREGKSGTSYVFQNILSIVHRKVAIFLNKLTDETLNINIENPIKNTKQFAYITFKGCLVLEPKVTVEEEPVPIAPSITTVLAVAPTVSEEPIETGDYVDEIKADVKPFEPEQGESILDEEELFEFDIEKIAIAEIPEWNRIYSDTDIIQTITTELQKYYYEKKVQKNTYTIGNDSQSFYDMLKKYQAVDKDNVPIRDFKHAERYYSPYLELVKKGRYDSIPVLPIIINSKTVYSPELLKDSQDNSEEDIRVQIVNYIKIYRSLVKNEIKYKEFMNLIMNGGSVPVDNETVQLYPFYETYHTPDVTDMKDYKFYETTTIKPTNVVHLGLSSNHPINIYRSLYNQNTDIPITNLPYIRTTNGIPITYQDQKSDTYYNERTAEKPTTESCNGTMGSDMKFAQNNAMSDFFKSINKQPIEVNITDLNDPARPAYEGERVFIVGFFIPSINYIKNTKSLTEIRDDKENTKVYPKISSTRDDTSILKLDKDNLEIIESSDDFRWETIDVEKNYMVFFDSRNTSSENRLTDEGFMSILEKIFPNIDVVINKQYDRLKNCMNLLETQEILAEYDIDINQVSVENDKKLQLKQNFTEKMYSLKKTVSLQKSKLTQLQKYIETVRSIYHELLLLKWKKSSVDVESQMKSILNSHPKIILFMFLNYYVSDHTKCINIDSYLSYEIEDMVKIISKWFINNTPHVETLSEFYRWFSTQSIDIDDELISTLFNKYLKLFKLDKLLEFKTHGTGIYDQYFLRELQMVWNLNHNYNGGRHLLEIFQLIQIIKYQKYINESIETYAKEEYMNTIGAGEDSWDTLTDEQKLQFQPSSELISRLKMEINDIFMTYETERKKYNLYNKCDKYRIVKIYNSLESLYKDNRPNVYYDTKFDTTPFDVKEYVKFRDNYCGNLSSIECLEKFKAILNKFYIFDSEIELNNKIESVMTALKEPKHKSRRLVKDSDIALVVINGKQDYYQRIKNFWSPLREKGITVEDVNTDLLALNFKQVAMRVNVSVEEPSMTGDEDCVNVPYESQMIPKALKEQYIKYITSSRKVSVLEKVLEFSKQVESDKTYLLNKLQREYDHLEFMLTQSDIDTVTKLDGLEVEDISIYPPQYITNELAKILAIEDTDMQYRELEIFLKQWGAEYNMNITKHLLNDNAMEEDIKNNEILENQDNYPNNSPFSKLQTSLATSTYYFYNDRLPKVNVPIVCKHYSGLIKSAYGSNSDRKNALDDIVKIWGVTTQAHHICKNCGEILRERDFSIMEGFDKDDRTVRFREKVISDIDIMDSLEDTDIIPEESMDSKLKTTMKTTLREITIVFKGFLSTIGLKFTVEDYINVLQWTFTNVNEAYYNERYNKVEEGLNAIFGKKSADPAVNKKREQQKNILLKSFQLTFYVERLIASIVHLYMTSIPEYVMKGTGAERKVKTGYIIESFYNNPNGALKYFIDKFTPLVKNKVNNIFAVLGYLLLDGTFKSLYPKIYPTDETESSFYQYVKKSYEDYLEQLSINKRYELYDNYHKEKVKQQRQLARYEKWSTFAPPLEYAENIPSYTDPMTKISDSIRNSNVLLYQYYNVIHNYPQTTIERSKYVTYVLFDNIRNNFIDALIQQDPNIAMTYANLKKLYEGYSAVMIKDIQGIQYIISKIKGRDLQDYMDVNKALLADALPEEHANIIKKNTENKWLQFNLIIHLETDDSGKTVGKRRVYKELEDMDYELLSGLYTNIPENETVPEFYEEDIRQYLYTQLKNKYPSYPDDLINFKIDVITHMNSDTDKLTATYDIVSNQFKTDIIKRVRSEIVDMTTEEIEKMLLENEKFSYIEVGKLISFRSIDNMLESQVLRTRESAENIYISTGIKKLLQLLNVTDVDINTFAVQLADKKDTVNPEDIETFKVELSLVYGTIIGTKISDLINSISAGEHPDTKKILLDMGSYNKVYNESLNALYETLKIEGFISEAVTDREARFRKNLFSNDKMSMELRNMIMITYTILSRIRYTSYESLKEIDYKKYTEALTTVCAFNDIYDRADILKQMNVINPFNMVSLVRLICLKLIDAVKKANLALLLQTIINIIKQTTESSDKSTKESYDIVTKKRARENAYRKESYDKMTEEFKAVYGMYRSAGIGGISAKSVNNEVMLTDMELMTKDLLAIQVEGFIEEDPDAEEKGYVNDRENEYDDED